MSQFPLALSIEPRLLPLAVANGFHMDSKVHPPYSFIPFMKLHTHYHGVYSTATSFSARCSRK